jgi:bacterioferritin
MNRELVIEKLNKALENEYAGVVRYSHYSLMIFGFNRIPIVGWFRAQSAESLAHAEAIGEKITGLGGHPSLQVGQLLETHKHAVSEILQESLEHERAQIAILNEALVLVNGDIYLEEFIRTMIMDETEHVNEIIKMLIVPQ